MIVRGETGSTVKPVPLRVLPERPLVSVLIANFNYADYLREAIESVLRSGYSPFEIIICDDGSTDHSLAVLDSYRARDARVKVLMQENVGQGVAMYKAYAASSGEIICLLDSDDRFHAEKLERVVAAFRRSPESGFLIHRMRVVGACGRFLGFNPAVRALPAGGWYGPRMPLSAPQSLYGLPATSALSLRRQVADRILPLAARRRVRWADIAVYSLAPLATPLLSIENALSDYRMHGKNESSQDGSIVTRVKRFLAVENETWLVWSDYLFNIAEQLPSGFVPPTEPPVTVWSYALARVQRRNDYKDLHRRLLTSPCYKGISSGLYRLYWRLSILLPDPAFRWSLAFAYSPGPTKAALGRVANGLRTSLEILLQAFRELLARINVARREGL